MQIFDKYKQHCLIKKLKKICLHPAYFAGSEIYRLLNYDTLQKMVVKIKKGKIQLSSKLLFGRKIISSEEQFIYLLNKYIVFVRDNFHIRTNECIAIIEETLKSPYSKIFYSHLDFNCDENYKFFHQEFKKLFLDKLLKNYKMFCDNQVENKLFQELKTLSLDIEKELEIVFQVFQSILNERKADLYYFFVEGIEDKDNAATKKFYSVKWKYLIENYLNSNEYQRRFNCESCKNCLKKC